MQLVMYLGNDFIAAVCINAKQIVQPGYMGQMKRLLLEKNGHLLQHADEEPEFLLVNLSDRKEESQRE